LGGSTTDAGWALETSLDVEWAHALAPAAKILLVEANSSSLGDLFSAVSYASTQAGVSVVSMSWGTTEFWGQSSYDSLFTTPAGHS
ncbi:S8 family serine peptidase, partial [Pseudomonas jessenii]|uniref:S8 family serine peptidase n=1 Tax=Pseudomonas jessenii TaxID=77298 RepID=UPI0030BA5F0F